MNIIINKRWHMDSSALKGMTKEGFIEAFQNAGTGEDLNSVWEKVKEHSGEEIKESKKKKPFQERLDETIEKKEESPD